MNNYSGPSIKTEGQDWNGEKIIIYVNNVKNAKRVKDYSYIHSCGIDEAAEELNIGYTYNDPEELILAGIEK